MGGRIGFESIEGQGTTFWFELPLAESISASNERALMDKLNKTTTAEPLNDNIKTKNILYVEDNPANRQLMTSFFARQANLILHTAETGELGLEMINNQSFDLVLMDIHLPGIDGKEVTQIIRNAEKLKGLPVIAVTAVAMKHDIDDSKRLFDAYLTKPVDFNVLLDAINKELDK